MDSSAGGEGLTATSSGFFRMHLNCRQVLQKWELASRNPMQLADVQRAPERKIGPTEARTGAVQLRDARSVIEAASGPGDLARVGVDVL